MSTQITDRILGLFKSRLQTLEQLLNTADREYSGGVEALLGAKIIDDMLPLGTQIAFTCNQAHHFALWYAGKELTLLEPQIVSLAQAKKTISDTLEELEQVNRNDEKLAETKRIDLPEGRYLMLKGQAYVDDWLLPNFYFHLVTAYNILRKNGINLGKRNFMLHLLPYVEQDNG